MTQTTTNRERALRIARGSYQVGLVLGNETLGGSRLRGRAKQYGIHYDQSARNLLRRLDEAGIPHHVVYGPKGGWHSAVLVIDEEAQT